MNDKKFFGELRIIKTQYETDMASGSLNIGQLEEILAYLKSKNIGYLNFKCGGLRTPKLTKAGKVRATHYICLDEWQPNGGQPSRASGDAYREAIKDDIPF